MSRIAVVLSSARELEDGAHGLDIKADPGGGNNVTAPHYADPGDDSCPLPGDYVALEDSSGGSGAEQATGYADVRNAGKAAPGEKRLYGRKSSGDVVVELWLRGNGSLVISNDAGSFEMAPGGDVTINGVVIDVNGNVRAKGEVTAKTGPQQVSLTTHKHVSGTGPTTPPTPGT